MCLLLAAPILSSSLKMGSTATAAATIEAKVRGWTPAHAGWSDASCRRAGSFRYRLLRFVNRESVLSQSVTISV